MIQKYLSLLIFSIISLTITASTTLASESDLKRFRAISQEDELQISSELPTKPPEQLCDGIWVGEGVAATGERLYFGMEEVKPPYPIGWEVYNKHISEMCCNCGESFCHTCRKKNSGLLTRLINLAYPFEPQTEIYKELQQLSGFNQEDFEQYVLKLRAANILPGTSKFKQLETCAQTWGEDFYCGDETDKNKEQYRFCVAYISKVPISGYFPFATQKEEEITIRQFNEIYKNVVMSVGVYEIFTGKKGYRNFGILRNPTSIIEGGYKNVALQLHGFTAAVVRKFFPHKQYLEILNPLFKMQEMLCKNLKPEDMFIWHPGCIKNFHWGFSFSNDCWDSPRIEFEDDITDHADIYSETEGYWHYIKIDSAASFYK